MIYHAALCVTSLILTTAITSIASAQTDPVRVAATYTKMYAVDGYDSNDHIQLVGEGMFRNTCYRHAETSVAVDEATKVITVGPVAYEYPGYCLQVVLPFQRVIDVGLLKAGKWTIQQGAGMKIGELNVVLAKTNSADDYLYAPISQAFFRQAGGNSEVILSGEFSNDCMTLDYEKVSIQPSAIVIQPVAKMDNRLGCKQGKFPFTRVVPITGLAAGRYLLHVRSTGGNALNSLVDAN